MQEYITQCCNQANLYDFYTIFKHFSAFEIRRKEDINLAVDDFFAFLVDCDQAFFKKGIENPPKLMQYSAKALKFVMLRPLTPEQQYFADMVKTIAPKKQHTRLLDVGAGIFPKVSFYLAESIDSVSAMDKQFLLSQESMRGMNVTAYQQLFDANSQIADYDFVVGRRPCSAISTIVEACVQHNKPYCIELCDCVLPKDEKKKMGVSAWYERLIAIDPNLTYLTGGFVYNLDITKAQGERVIKPIVEAKAEFNRYKKKHESNRCILDDVDFKI